MEPPRDELDADLAFGPGFWAVIPAGGSGTRLWPLSRTARPKFLLPLLAKRSLLQQTSDRLQRLVPSARTLVVCGPSHAAAVARQLPEIPEMNMVVEPAPKGTGPAIGLAAAIIARQDPDAIMGSFAADHHVQNPAAFAGALRVAVQAARQGHLVTIGLDPIRPETGYGYIERTSEVLSDTPDGYAYRAASFHEKPDLAAAKGYIESGRFLWNASMFVWRVATLLDELSRLQPELFEGVTKIASVWGTPDQERVTADVWAGLAESTIDQGVMERTTNVAVVPASMGWSDVGDWHGLGALLTGIEGDNRSTGIITVDADNTIVWSETGRVIAIVGLDDVVVVDVADAILVASRDRAQDVRNVVDHLRNEQRLELL